VPLNGDTQPQVLSTTPGFNAVCVDESFDSPAGVHMSLWRYIEVARLQSGLCPSVWIAKS
jgi:hypothetical protein